MEKPPLEANLLKTFQATFEREITSKEVTTFLEAMAAREGMAVKSIGGSGEAVRHWHLARGKGSGTVEVTLDQSDSSVTVGVHDNRRGNWAGEAAEQMAKEIAKSLL